MKGKKRANSNVTIGSSSVHWKRRPSEISGYQRTLYINTDEGDYIRVDYNTKDKRVRLYLEDGEEGGNPYFAVVSNGTITTERNVTTGRSCSLSGKLKKRAGVISTISNKDVLRLINNNYGISENYSGLNGQSLKRREEIEKIRGRYFKKGNELPGSAGTLTGTKAKFRFLDMIDIAVGILICVGVFFIKNSFIHVGVISALFGVSIGVMDIFFREREPILTKILLFIIPGFAFYIYGYYLF